MRQYMLRVTSTLLFGMDDPEAACRLGDMIARWVALNHQVGVGALVPNERFTDGYEELLGFAEELEAEVLGMIRRRRESREPGNDVLSILVRSHDEEGGLSDEELVGQAAVLFGAAHMTTAHSLTWTLLLLAQHPSIMRSNYGTNRQRQRVRRIARIRNPQSAIRNRSVPFPKGDDLSLLDRVIKESMRLLPASAYSQRINTVAVQLGPLRFAARHRNRLYADHHAPFARSVPAAGEVHSRSLAHVAAEPVCVSSVRRRAAVVHWCSAGDRRYPHCAATNSVAFRLSVVPGSDVSAHIESTMLFPTHGVPMEIHPADGKFASSPITGNLHELVDFDEVPDVVVQDAPANGNGDPHWSAPRLPR